MKEYWYRVEVLNGDETYCFFGSSKYKESEFVRRLTEREYLLLEHLVFYNEDQEAKSWSEWEPNSYSRVYLNPQYIVSLMPLVGDPRKREGAENKILNLPGTMDRE